MVCRNKEGLGWGQDASTAILDDKNNTAYYM